MTTTGPTETDRTPSPSAGPFGAPYCWVFADGRFIEDAVASVSLHANILSYGTGTFEGMRGFWNEEQQQLYLLEAAAHFRRMRRSATILGRPLHESVEELVAAATTLLRRNDVRSDVYVRPLFVLTGEELPVRMHGITARLSIAATPVVGDYIDPGGIRCKISTWRRAPDNVMPSRAKVCGSYVGPALAKTEAINAGYDEAIMLNSRGNVAEGTTSNVFMRRGTEWITPSVNEDVLEGVTRGQLKTLLEERTGAPVTERGIQPSELFACDELLLCGTAALVVPVVSVDDRPIADGVAGATTISLLEELRSIACRTSGRHHEWTMPIYDDPEAP